MFVCSVSMISLISSALKPFVIGHRWEDLLFLWVLIHWSLSFFSKRIFLWVSQFTLVFLHKINWCFGGSLEIVFLTCHLCFSFSRLLLIQKCCDRFVLNFLLIWVGSVISVNLGLVHELVEVVSIWVRGDLCSWFDVVLGILLELWDIAIKLGLISGFIFVKLILFFKSLWVLSHLFTWTNVVLEFIQIVVVQIFTLLNLLKSLTNVMNINLVVDSLKILLETSQEHVLFVIEILLNSHSALLCDKLFYVLLYSFG